MYLGFVVGGWGMHGGNIGINDIYHLSPTTFKDISNRFQLGAACSRSLDEGYSGEFKMRGTVEVCFRVRVDVVYAHWLG